MSDSSEVLDGDESSPFGVEKTEDMVDIVSSIVLDESRREEVDELFERNIASALSIQVQDDLVNGLVAGLRAKRSHSVPEL